MTLSEDVELLASPVGEIRSTTPCTVSLPSTSAEISTSCPTCTRSMSFSLTRTFICKVSRFSMTNMGLLSSDSSAKRPTVVFTLVTVPLMALRIWQSLRVEDWMLAFCWAFAFVCFSEEVRTAFPFSLGMSSKALCALSSASFAASTSA